MSIDEQKFQQILELELAKFFGQTVTYLDKRFNKLVEEEIKPLKDKFNHMQNSLDGFLGRQNTDEEERAAMNNQLDRHEGWINELAKSSGTKLSPP